MPKLNLSIYKHYAKAPGLSIESLFRRWCGENWITMCKVMFKMDTCLRPHRKLNMEWNGKYNSRGGHKGTPLLCGGQGHCMQPVTQFHVFLREEATSVMYTESEKLV